MNIKFENLSFESSSCFGKMQFVYVNEHFGLSDKVLETIITHAENFAGQLLAKELNILGCDEHFNIEHNEIPTVESLEKLGYKENNSSNILYLQDIVQDRPIKLFTKRIKAGALDKFRNYNICNENQL